MTPRRPAARLGRQRTTTPRRTIARLGTGLTLVLAVAGCGSGGRAGGGSAGTAASTSTTASAAECVQNEQGTGCLPLAPERQRVDRTTPVFTRPTEITNPLFPVAAVAQSLQLGSVDGEPFRAEVTLLPGTKPITWNGRQVPTRIHQYVAYSTGRILEVALDWYAQADDGSVWYFGEDVFNYEDGVVADTHGTWLAGKDGPAGMLMPADPSPGQVYRPENIPELVFEQVTVKSTGQMVPGPRGPVDGALVVSELHLDGKTEAKTFAPGYGEFSAGGGGDLETVALAVPVDAAGGAPPAELATLAADARSSFDAAGAAHWADAASTVDAMAAAWQRLDGTDPPRLLARQLTGTLAALAAAVDARDPARARQAALRAEQAALDLELRHRPPAEVDLARLDLWARQLQVDATAEDAGAVAGDVATMEVHWERLGHTAAPAAGERVTAALRSLRGAADEEKLESAAAGVPALRNALAVWAEP
jgi:hypothetical protein